MTRVVDEHGPASAAARIAAVFARHDVRLTIGGEPTFVPVDPRGEEWHHAAVGPTKLGYARGVADHLLADAARGAVAFFAPGKSYPGECNPRWAIWLVRDRDGRPLFHTAGRAPPTVESTATARAVLATRLGVAGAWRQFEDPRDTARPADVWALLLDHAAGRWQSGSWPPQATTLTYADGPAGLRLPLHMLPDDVARRVLVFEHRDERLAIFLPPVLQDPFIDLLGCIAASVDEAGIGAVELQGPIPADTAGRWVTIGLTADPGVLEINLPTCHSWHEYDHWMREVTRAAAACGLRSWREPPGGHPEDSGGGNHLLWGGPTLEHNPFFRRPSWVASMLRYWQLHPALAYVFTGRYVGPHSQAPRVDESGWQPHDLEWAWCFLESLPAGDDHREAIAATIRHLQTDVAGNGHRTEICFDKFWNVGRPGGAAGLIEFRALASMPSAEWSSGVGLLWSALAAWLLDHPCRQPMRDFGRRLHDRCLLPLFLWDDLAAVLAELAAAGFALDVEVYRAIWNWRFPVLLAFSDGDARLTVRQALEPWPLLNDAVADGTTTSRFIDTSVHRLECVANAAFMERWQVRIAGRPLALRPASLRHDPPHDGSPSPGRWLAGVRYRRTQLHPSLHPGIRPHLPLELAVVNAGEMLSFLLTDESPVFQPRAVCLPPPPGPPCRSLHPDDNTFDLRLSKT